VSVFVVGQNAPLGFFLVVYEPESPFDATLEFWLVFTVVAVDETELDDDTDEDEFVLCTVFLCGINIRDTSSALIEFNPFGAAPLFHPNRGSDWKLGGEATAVVIE
jgi:hypothetical protein